MNFYEMSLLLEFTSEKLLEIVKRIFGDCRNYPNLRWTNCKFKNREISFTYHPHAQIVSISFDFLEDPEEFGKPEAFYSARRLQAGTIEGISKVREFAKELKSHGIGIAYTTEGRRREKLYARIMKQAGFKKPDDPSGEWHWEWR